MNTIISTFFLCFVILVSNSKNINAEKLERNYAEENEFPYQGLLFIDRIYRCGATLITSSHLITVASCIANLVTKRPVESTVEVMLGSINRITGSIHNVKRISHHIAFKTEAPYLNLNDIAIIHLLHAVNITDNISPIGLPRLYEKVPIATEVITSGFGPKNIRDSPPLLLSKMTSQIASLEDCNNWYPSYFLLNTQICTLKDPYYGYSVGDSGSPMVDVSKKILLGIVSISNLDSKNEGPDIYTDISFYIPYIREEINYYTQNSSFSIAHPGINFAWTTEKLFV